MVGAPEDFDEPSTYGRHFECHVMPGGWCQMCGARCVPRNVREPSLCWCIGASDDELGICDTLALSSLIWRSSSLYGDPVFCVHLSAVECMVLLLRDEWWGIPVVTCYCT